jgi:molybdate transport system substrate-binding protein
MTLGLRHSLALIVLALLTHAAACDAAQLTVFASSAVAAAMRGLVPQFERDSGNTLNVRYDTTMALKGDIESGAAFDVAILTAAANESLTSSGKILATASSAIARSGIGVVVRAGAPKPDINTAEAFKRSLLSAKSVAFTANGASGTYFEALLQRLGIADAVNAKALRPSGGTVGELVAHGDAELGVQQISELLPVAGIDYVGPLPADYQNYTVFNASLGAQAKDPSAGKALIAFLLTPAARKLFSVNGMEAPQGALAAR